jgi:hypothetical protein
VFGRDAASAWGRTRLHPAELARMYTLGLDTIAGAKMLQVKFGTAGAFQPGQTVLHKERRARIIRISADTAAIRYWGESDHVAVPPEALSLPLNTVHDPAPRASKGADSSFPAWPLDWRSRAVRAREGRRSPPVPSSVSSPRRPGRRPVFGISRMQW